MIVVWFAAAIWLAIVTSLTLDWVFFPIFLAGLILAMVLPFKFTQLRSAKQLALIFATLLGLSGFSLAIQNTANRPAEFSKLAGDYQSMQFQFEVLEQPKALIQVPGQFRVAIRTLPNADISSKLAAAGSVPSARGTLRGGSEVGDLANGSVYRATLELSPARQPRDAFSARMAGSALEVRAAPAINQGISAVRDAFLSNLVGVNSDSAALVAGLAIGDTSQLSAELDQAMTKVGLTHLNAVSGANCAIVMGAVLFLFRRAAISRWVRLAISLTALIGYIAIVGAQPSVLRAGLMAAVVIFAVASGRKAAPVGALALSIVLLLIADPWLALDFGFALSVFATLGILVLAPEIYQRLKTKFPIWFSLGLAVTLGAQLLCIPVLLQLQDGLATYSVLANLLAEPVVPFVTVLGILACILALFTPSLAVVLSFLASLGTWWISELARYCANLPAGEIPWPTGLWGSALAIFLTAASVLVFKSHRARTRLVAGATVFAIIATTSGVASARAFREATWVPENWQAVACDVGQGDALVLRSQEEIAVIDVGPEAQLIDKCLTTLGIAKIDLLVITHFDFDHVGGLSGALKGRSVETALISPFADDRPAAEMARSLLSSSSARVIEGAIGHRGTLGSADWIVLNPQVKARGHTDSNDASIALFFSFDRFSLLALADLGERAQSVLRRKFAEIILREVGTKQLILKVAHHGSADFDAKLHQIIRPSVALISVGAKNGYGHPTAQLLQTLENVGATVARTDRSGTIAISTDQDRIMLTGFRND